MHYGLNFSKKHTVALHGRDAHGISPTLQHVLLIVPSHSSMAGDPVLITYSVLKPQLRQPACCLLTACQPHLGTAFQHLLHQVCRTLCQGHVQ